jgi:hypothetical protein
MVDAPQLARVQTEPIARRRAGRTAGALGERREATSKFVS